MTHHSNLTSALNKKVKKPWIPFAEQQQHTAVTHFIISSVMFISIRRSKVGQNLTCTSIHYVCFSPGLVFSGTVRSLQIKTFANCFLLKPDKHALSLSLSVQVMLRTNSEFYYIVLFQLGFITEALRHRTHTSVLRAVSSTTEGGNRRKSVDNQENICMIKNI